MAVRYHPHTRERMKERDATDYEVKAGVHQCEQFPAKLGRTASRRNFALDSE